MPKVNFICKNCKFSTLCIIETNITKSSSIDRLFRWNDDNVTIRASHWELESGENSGYYCGNCRLHVPAVNPTELFDWLHKHNMLDWEN